MVGILASLLQGIGFLVKQGITFARWVFVHVRTAYLQIWVLWNWYVTWSRSSIILHIVAWGLWTAAIEAALLWFSTYIVEAFPANAIAGMMPSSGSALLYLFWEHGVCLETAFSCMLTLFGLWLLMQALLRRAHNAARLAQARWNNPRAYSLHP